MQNSPANVDQTVVKQATDFFQSIADNWQDWLWALGITAAAIVVALIVHLILFRLLVRLTRRTKWRIDDYLVKQLRRPSRLLFPLLAVLLALPSFQHLTKEGLDVVRHVISILLIAAATWLALALLSIGEHFVLARHKMNVSDNLAARRIHTQLSVIRRTVATIIIIVGVAAILMTFPRIRQLGASLLASAGLAGLIIGLAARPTVENLIAGMQLALTQPIRLDDVVIISGEWGRIEEITSTYVVVRIWDERRLIVPFSKFISEPFQNWTRTSAEILGTVYVYCDYRVPVQKVREEVERICKASDKWDKRVAGLVVTDSKEQTLELRALVSAADSGAAWDLRCELREKLVDFLQREYPDSLPRIRAEVREPDESAGVEPAAAGA